MERLPDGSMVIQGSALLKDLKSDFNLPFEESPDYHTLAGFVLAKLQRIPRAGKELSTTVTGSPLSIWKEDGS